MWIKHQRMVLKTLALQLPNTLGASRSQPERQLRAALCKQGEQVQVLWEWKVPSSRRPLTVEREGCSPKIYDRPSLMAAHTVSVWNYRPWLNDQDWDIRHPRVPLLLWNYECFLQKYAIKFIPFKTELCNEMIPAWMSLVPTDLRASQFR